MKKTMIALFALCIATVAGAQTGKVFEELTLESKILKGPRKFALYLPPDYETSQRSYPVLYLLHGAGDNQTGWVQFGEVLHIANQAIAQSKATPMIIVMPDADSGVRGYFNAADGTFNYENFFFDELIPHIEKTYRVKAERRYRAVAGLSMGGGGTLIYALHRPEMFAAACPLSAAVRWMNPEMINKQYNKEGKLSQQQIENWYAHYDILGLVEKLPNFYQPDQMRQHAGKLVRMYIDCGDDDFLFEGNALLHIALRKKGYPHEYRVRNGGHTWEYWRTALPEVLSFVSQSFRQF